MREHRVAGHEKDEAPTGATAVLSVGNRTVLGVQLRYAYRLSPTAGQRQASARAFGCARVVFNDAVAARRAAHEAGVPYPTDAAVIQGAYRGKAHPRAGVAGRGVGGRDRCRRVGRGIARATALVAARRRLADGACGAGRRGWARAAALPGAAARSRAARIPERRPRPHPHVRATEVRLPDLGVDSTLVDLDVGADGVLEPPADPDIAGWYRRGGGARGAGADGDRRARRLAGRAPPCSPASTARPGRPGRGLPLRRDGVRLPGRLRREPPQGRLPDGAGLRPGTRLRAPAGDLRGRVRPAPPPLPGQRRRHRRTARPRAGAASTLEPRHTDGTARNP